MTDLSTKEYDVLKECWRRSPGRSWEPKEIRNPLIQRFVYAGFIRIVDGRCGFEKIKDSMVQWTEAGRQAFNRESDR